jgi:hypothetical protein
MSAMDLVAAVVAAGGELSIEGDRIHYRIPMRAAFLLKELRLKKREVIEHLRERERRNTLAYLRQFLGKQVWTPQGPGKLLAVDDCVTVGLENDRRKHWSDPSKVLPYA